MEDTLQRADLKERDGATDLKEEKGSYLSPRGGYGK
jgi:hypothetical protein